MANITLRALTISDIDKTFSWHNDEEISEMYSGHPFPVNMEMERKWYDKILTSNFPVTVFGIEHNGDSKLIGISLLKDLNMINRSAEFAIYIGDKAYRGKGYSKEATLETLRFGFNKLGLNRIFLRVLEDNLPAKKLYDSLNFSVEGILRSSVFKNNTYKNEVVMAILKEEFGG